MVRIAMIVAALVGIPLTGFSDTIHVPGDQPTIQAGIDAAENGDVVLVAAGTYNETIDFLGKAITVKSEEGPKATILNSRQNGSVVTFNSGEGSDSIIEGFSIRNGSGTNDGNGFYSGGGVYCTASPTITGNIISFNSVNDSGGGIYSTGNPRIEGNTIAYNAAENDGGGIYSSGSPEIVDNTIQDNFATGGGAVFESWGGGICCSTGDLLIKNNVIIGNQANTYSSVMDGLGGGICTYLCSGSIEGNLIRSNIVTWGYGAGICCKGGSCSFSNNTIVDNLITQHWYGGGFYLEGYNGLMTNNVIAGNEAHSGGGIYCQFSGPTILGCTIVENECALNGYGGGIFGGSCVVTNSILWNNVNSQIYYSSSPPTVTYSDVEGGWSGLGNIDADPLFADQAAADFHLTFNSPCREEGDNSAPGLPSADIEGDPRDAYGIVDMGADEFYTHLYIMGDATPGGTIQGKLAGTPGTTPVAVFLGIEVRPSPLPTAWGDFYILPPWRLIPLVPIPSNGILALSVIIEVTTPAPYDIPLQGLVGLNSDSLTNLFILKVR